MKPFPWFCNKQSSFSFFFCFVLFICLFVWLFVIYISKYLCCSLREHLYKRDVKFSFDLITHNGYFETTDVKMKHYIGICDDKVILRSHIVSVFFQQSCLRKKKPLLRSHMNCCYYRKFHGRETCRMKRIRAECMADLVSAARLQFGSECSGWEAYS